MAKKSAKQAAISAPVAYKPKPRVRMELSALPDNLPDIKKLVRLEIEGKITELSVPGADYSSLACLTIAPTSVKVESEDED